ncbi:MAG: radical SAM protein [Candidatus Thermoplasmatota archaeon]
MEIKQVDLLITYKCPSKCKHCLYKSGPHREGVMDVKDAKDYLNQLKDYSLKWVTITGGEPFMYYDRLLEIVKIAKDINPGSIWVLTNAYWAKSRENAREKLLKLRGAGLTHIMFSVDCFHQEYIPVECVSNALGAAKDVGFEQIQVDSYLLSYPESKNQFDLSTLRILSQINLENIKCNQYTPMVGGRTAELLTKYFSCNQGIHRDKCKLPSWIGGDLREPLGIEIDPFGYVYFCPGLTIGNAKEKELARIIEDYDCTKHPIIKIIEREGPIGLLRIAMEKGFVPLEGYIDKCHLCYETRKFLRPYFQEHLAPKECYEG